ncbi:hypothetical protein I3760_07G214900 [Carya illinoinensis]|nr:hypothetical protein I3760_07G214900 [Carya illinoinensis]KAG2700043.1 hypothetical protein I3760_07G214900 [Carya illinoinensis]
MSTKLTKEGEFLIMGCDGIWDVFVSQNALDFAQDMVDEAMKRKSGDNLAVVVVCFQHQPPSNLIAPRSRVHRSFSAKGLSYVYSIQRIRRAVQHYRFCCRNLAV